MTGRHGGYKLAGLAADIIEGVSSGPILPIGPQFRRVEVVR